MVKNPKLQKQTQNLHRMLIPSMLNHSPQAIMMVEAMEVTEVQAEKIPEEEYFEKMKVVYPRAEEDLIDFLNRCKLENKGVMLCARCSVVCDKEATEGLKRFQPATNKQG